MDDYVSREAAKKEIAKEFCDNCKLQKVIACQECNVAACHDIVEDLEAADVQPIKHGRWIGITEYCKKNGYIPSGMGIYYWCSECGKEEQKTSDYCPNCGADMRGGAENDAL